MGMTSGNSGPKEEVITRIEKENSGTPTPEPTPQKSGDDSILTKVEGGEITQVIK